MIENGEPIMELTSLMHILYSWWFPIAMFLLPIAIYILYAIIRAAIEATFDATSSRTIIVTTTMN